jgi:hypothetical protein
MIAAIAARALLVFLGLAAAIAFAAIFTMLAMSFLTGTGFPGKDPTNTFLAIFQLGIMIAVFALVPSLIAIGIAERRKCSDVGTYIFVGALIGSLCAFLLIQAPSLVAIGAMIGAGSGLLYWLIAGRSIGSQRNQPSR